MSILNKLSVVIAFVVCATNAWAADVMKNDPNAIGILDCVYEDSISLEEKWEKENYDCSAKHKSWSHNYHSTKAVCKKFVADAYYKKYKDKTGMTGVDVPWPDGVNKLPELIDAKYMLRCVATECEDEYELARDKNGNSQGWCRKKSADKNEKANTGEKSGSGQGDTAESNNGESGDDNNVTESESAKEAAQEEIKKSDNVFAEIDVDLNKYFSKSSVWKKEDGSFNTARLASDSIAGVVLGTTGGIITSNVIKKNQIKKGFEDLKCTIGGQSVAAYGDEFSVGVK